MRQIRDDDFDDPCSDLIRSIVVIFFVMILSVAAVIFFGWLSLNSVEVLRCAMGVILYG